MTEVYNKERRESILSWGLFSKGECTFRGLKKYAGLGGVGYCRSRMASSQHGVYDSIAYSSFAQYDEVIGRELEIYLGSFSNLRYYNFFAKVGRNHL
jgi:hypothetical protein